MKDPHLTECPISGCIGPVKRRIGAGAGFIFKGSGFYITDYRSDAYKAAAKKNLRLQVQRVRRAVVHLRAPAPRPVLLVLHSWVS